MSLAESIYHIRLPSLEAIPAAREVRPGLRGAAADFPKEIPWVEHLLARQAVERQYDSEIAHLLAVASGWAYAGPLTFSLALAMEGLTKPMLHTISVENDAMLIAATAYFVRSSGGRLGLLCFRGTEPTNVISWLTDANIDPVQFPPLGQVHGGFYTNLWAIWKVVSTALTEPSPSRPFSRTSKCCR